MRPTSSSNSSIPRADAKPAGQALVDLLETAAQVLRLGENAVSVVENEPSLRRQADEVMAALDDRRAETLFELPDRRRKRRLRHMAGLRGLAEMLLAGERNQIFELLQHHSASPCLIGDARPCQGQ